MIHGYDIKTSFDFFRKLLDEREDFLKNPSSARYAINCAITAWQLHDWVYAERSKYPFMSQFNTKADFRKYLYNENDFKTIHDLADGAKHYVLTNRRSSILDTKVSSWKKVNKHRISNDDSTQLFLTMDWDKVPITMSFDDLLYSITFFWCNFFEDNLKEDVTSLFNRYTWF